MDQDLDNPQDIALVLAPIAASVANYCDRIEHNEEVDRAWVQGAGNQLRQLADRVAADSGKSIIDLYAERLGEIEARNVLGHPGAFDGHHAALEARTWRDLQVVQADHDRHYHPDVVGLAKLDQLRHYALHLAKIAGAFAEPRDHTELFGRRLPDALLFGLKLATVTGARLTDDPLPQRVRGLERTATS